MARSAFARFADQLCRQPCWLEQNGDRFIEVRGYSVVESLAALAAGILVIAAAVAVLAVMP